MALGQGTGAVTAGPERTDAPAQGAAGAEPWAGPGGRDAGKGETGGGETGAGPDLALLGHDIRSAVSDILGGLRLVDPVSLPEAAQSQIARARAAAETLARLLDAVLQDDALNEYGLQDGAPGDAETPLLDLLQDAERRWSAHARDIGMDLHVTRHSSLPPVIGLDRTRLERILSNLLSNAIKYSGRGTVRLDVGLDGEGTLVFAVRDQGTGFAPEVLERLFGRGVRAPGDTRRGHGMGLYICKDLADQMGGSLSVETAATGATVRLVLPAEAWRLTAARDGPARQCDLTGMRALLVEDSPTNQALMRQMLQRMGAQVISTGDGEGALASWRSAPCDFALVDIELPGLSGLEVIREIRATPGAAGRLPILAVTAYVLRSNREAIFAAGADGVMAKPLSSFNSFAQAVTRLLRRTDTGAAPGAVRAATVPPRGPDPRAPAPYDRETLQHLLGIAGPQGAQELLSRLKADLRTTYTELADGLARADMPVIRAKTHVLISLAGAIGARDCQSDAERMNDAAHRRDIPVLETTGGPALDRLRILIEAVSLERAGPEAAMAAMAGTVTGTGAVP